MGLDSDSEHLSPHQLTSLRIPTGWRIVTNSFYEIDPVVEDGVLEHADEFSSGMLYMERCVPGQEEKRFLLDLSWIPYRNPEGKYRVTVALDDFEHELKVFESRSRAEVQQKIEEYLSLIASEINLEDALRALT